MPSQNHYTLNEKRLKPIYEFLDNGNFKKAVNEADKVIKKQKDLIAAKVLKVIALQRLGRSDEAFQLSNEVVQLKPFDENSLQGMSLYYKEINQTELISPLYETAVKLVDDNQELLTHLFMSYVRQDDFPKMKTTAGKLYKKYKSAPYLYWNIMSSVLQAHFADNEELANKMHLPLAEKMIEKHIKEGKLESAAEIKLYLLVLNKMGKYEKALEVLDTDLAKRLLPKNTKGYTPEHLKLKISMGKHEEVNTESQKLLQTDSDSWNYILLYLDSLEKLMTSSETTSTSTDESEEEGAHRTVKEGVEQVKMALENQSAIKKRGPFLFGLEFTHRLHQLGLLQKGYDEGLPPVQEQLLEYTKYYLHKPCCVPELRKFLYLLEDNHEEFINGMKLQCEARLEENPQLNVYRDVSIQLIKRIIGCHKKLENKEKIELSQNFADEYMKHREPRSTTETCFVDNYIILSVILLLDVYYQTNNNRVLWRCVLLLEKCLQNGPSNYEAKLYLVTIYSKLGIFLPCLELFDSLDVKYVQHDTLEYLLTRYMTALGHFIESSQICQIAQNYYYQQRKENIECLITCYRNGAFDQILGIMAYRDAMDISLNNYTTKIEGSLVDIIFRWKGRNEEDLDELYKELRQVGLDMDKLKDHRDFDVITCYDDVITNQENIKTSFVEEKEMLKFRHLILLSLYHMTSYMTSSDINQDVSSEHPPTDVTTNQKCNFDLIEEIVAELNKQWNDVTVDVDRKYGEVSSGGPTSSRKKQFQQLNYRQNLTKMLKYCMMVMTSCSRQNSTESDDVIAQLNTLSSEIVSNFKDSLNMEDSRTPPCEDQNTDEFPQIIPQIAYLPDCDVIERTSTISELISISSIYLLCVKKFVKEIKMEIQRSRRKKKKISSIKKEVMENYLQFCTQIVEVMNEMSNKLTKYQNDLKMDPLESFAQISIQDEEDDLDDDVIIWKRILRSTSSSYTSSFKQQNEMIQIRISNLNECLKL